LGRVVRILLCAIVAALVAAGLRDDRRLRAEQLVAGLAEAPSGARAGSLADALEAAGPCGLAAAFDLLDDPSREVRAGAAAYLGRSRSRRATPHLIRLLRDDAPAVRVAAAEALGAIGDRRALPFLERTIGSEPPDVAQAALQAARRIRRQQDRLALAH